MGGWGEVGAGCKLRTLLLGTYISFPRGGSGHCTSYSSLSATLALLFSLPSPGQAAIYGDACGGECLLFFFFYSSVSAPWYPRSAVRCACAGYKREKTGKPWINNNCRPHCHFHRACELVPISSWGWEMADVTEVGGGVAGRVESPHAPTAFTVVATPTLSPLPHPPPKHARRLSFYARPRPCWSWQRRYRCWHRLS